jgi:hypothetical protein
VFTFCSFYFSFSAGCAENKIFQDFGFEALFRQNRG